MNDYSGFKKHSNLESVFFHLIPGILAGTAYYLLYQPLQTHGYPSMMALALVGIFILIPVELGILILQAKKITGTFRIKKILSYQTKIEWWQVLIFVLITIFLMGVIFTLMKPIDRYIQEKIFSWVPEFQIGLDLVYSKSKLLQTYILMSIFLVVLVPLFEELYFRGFLLPRTPTKLPNIVHTFLFAVYHIWSPWMILTRTIGLLPLVIIVKKKNLLIGIIAHIFVNSLDAITAFVYIASL